ncbi:MAG: FecR domain-containing protein, partial [Chloroflexota bacterium]
MSYDGTPADGPENPGLLTITMIVVAGLVLIVGCAGIYFFVGRGRPAATQGTTVIEVTKIPSLTPSLTAIPTETPTLEEGSGGGGLDTDTPAPIAAIRYATLGEIKGTVQIKNLALVDWTTVTTELSIPAGTMILTSEDSSVKVTLTEGTIVRVGSQTQVALTDLSGNTLDPVTKLTLSFGKVWSIVGNSLGAGKYEIDTPLGTASVLDSWMSTEHNTTVPLDIITCLYGHCRYKNGFGVQDLFDDQQLQSDGTGAPPAPGAMDANQAADWSLTKVPEVVTLTPSSTPTATATNTRTPSNTPLPTNTPNLTSTLAQATANQQATNNQATSNVQSTNNAGTSTSQAQVNNLTSTVFFFNATATALAGSTQNSFTATSFSFTATAFNATSNANGTNSANTSTASALTATSVAATATQAAIPKFSFAASTQSVAENAGTLSVTVNLSP